MKTPTTKIAFSFGIILASLTLATAKEAKTENGADYQLPEYKVEITNPVPTKILSPRVSRTQIGHEVEMIFNIKADGRTSNIRSKDSFQVRDLSATMKHVIEHWEFEPALNKDGNPVSVQVTLPVKVVRSEANAKQYASLAMAKPTTVALAK